MADRVHSKVGASSAYRWMECPGSIALSSKCPRQASSSYAMEGTAAHTLAEMCFKGECDAEYFLRQEIAVEDQFFEVTQEMADAVQLYLDVVREYLDNAPHKIFRIEEPFRLDWLHPDLYGTNDALIGEPYGKLTIIDYKHGKGMAVEAYDNTQLKYYATGALKIWEFAEVEVVIVQPRCPHKDGPVRRATYTADEIEAWSREVLLPAAIATEKADAPLKAGDHCYFCPAQAICPAIRNKVLKTAITAFPDDLTTPTPEAATVFLTEPEQLPPEELQKLLTLAPMIDGYLRAVEAYAESIAKKGVQVLGHKLVEKKTNRRWKSKEAAEEELKKEFGEVIYTKPELLSVAQMEKTIGKANWKYLETLWEKPKGELTLVHESDKREAQLPNLADPFDDLPGLT